MNPRAAYDQALDYLYSFVDYSLKHISELAKAEFNLDRMFALMEELGNPQDQYVVLHVAGTKGKGSVCALAASALSAAGLKTGLYTSPHLVDYTERVQVDGRPISHEELVDLVDTVRPAVAKIPKLTTFEITTAIGLLAFRRRGVEAAVVEVGLGGRLDATNIVAPLVSVITSLSFDHTLVLGDTLAKIAGEKAGIIKPGVPVVSAPQKAEALEVLESRAGAQQSSFTLVGRDVVFDAKSQSLDGQRISIAAAGSQSGAAKLPSAIEVTIPLLGPRQVENAAVAAAALWEMRIHGLLIPDAAIRTGFSEVRWPGRFEVVSRRPAVVIDSAHNRDSALHLRQALDTYFPAQPVVLLFSALEDKDISGILEELRPRTSRVVATRVDHPRAPTAEWIAEQVQQTAIPVESVTPPAAALERALALAGGGGVVLVAGSVAFAGEMRRAWMQLQDQGSGNQARDPERGTASSRK